LQPPRLLLQALRTALAGPFDIGISPGECVAVTGPSGSGKSLMLRMIADLDPNEGEAWLDGRPRSLFSAPTWRRQVVYVAADSGWWDDRVAAHFTDLGAARALGDRLGLKPELFDNSVLRLSTGERQRLALARAILVDSPVLLLDEPTGPLDGESVTRVEALLRERLARGTSVLMVTHDPAQAARMGDRHLRMRQGRLETN
jgi:ABC-type sulfate/molybdate transport systems ATPase subunit